MCLDSTRFDLAENQDTPPTFFLLAIIYLSTSRLSTSGLPRSPPTSFPSCRPPLADILSKTAKYDKVWLVAALQAWSCPTVATNALFSSRAGPPYRHMDLAKARALRFWASLWANSSAHANWDMHGERVDAGTAMVSHKQVGSCLPQCAVTTITARGLGRLACDY